MGGFGDYSGLYDSTDMGMGGYDPTQSYYASQDPYSSYFQGGDLNSILAGYPTSGTGEQMYYDNQTGQYLTLAQVQQIDPTYQAAAPTAAAPTGTNVQVPGGNTIGDIQQTPGTGGSWSQILSSLPGGLAALGSLGLTGAAVSSLFGNNTQQGPTSQTVTKPTALSDPRVQQLLGSTGTGTGAALTGNTGLLGASTQAAQNLQGPTGLLQGQINNIPQLNPQIQQAIQGNALGFSQGQVPTLNDPQAQAYFQNMLAGQNAGVDYNTTNSLSNAIDMLRQRGFAGGSEIFREGAPAAAMGPILAAANLAKSQNLAGINQQQLQYATQLPQIGSQLNSQQLGAQAVPFSAYTSALGSQSAIPQNALNSLMQQGSTTNQTTTGATPTLTQQLGQIAPLLGAAGGLATGATANGTNPLAGLYGGISGLFNG